MMTGHAVGGRRENIRDSQAELETHVYRRGAPRRDQRPPVPWDRVMVLQILRDLGPLPNVIPPPRRQGTLTRSAPRANVFLTPASPIDPAPPWAYAEETRTVKLPLEAEAGSFEIDVDDLSVDVDVEAAIDAKPVVGSDATFVRSRSPSRAPKVRRSRTPWLLFAMAFGISFGVAQDRPLRKTLSAQAVVATHDATAAVQSSALWLCSRVARILT